MTQQDAGGSFNTKHVFQYQCHSFCYLFNEALFNQNSLLRLTYPSFKSPGRQITTRQPRAAFDAGKSSHLNPVNALMPLHCHSENQKPAAAVEEFLSV